MAGESTCQHCGGPAGYGWGLIPNDWTHEDWEKAVAKRRCCYQCSIRRPEKHAGVAQAFGPAPAALNPKREPCPPRHHHHDHNGRVFYGDYCCKDAGKPPCAGHPLSVLAGGGVRGVIAAKLAQEFRPGKQHF